MKRYVDVDHHYEREDDHDDIIGNAASLTIFQPYHHSAVLVKTYKSHPPILELYSELYEF